MRHWWQALPLAVVDTRTGCASGISGWIVPMSGHAKWSALTGAAFAVIDAALLALTPISAFRPRRWHGALLSHRARTRFEIIEAGKRPVSAVADAQSESPPLTRARHREALLEARDALLRALAAPDAQPELMAEDVRLALRSIGRITGRVDVEDLLDVIFRDFCIGK